MDLEHRTDLSGRRGQSDGVRHQLEMENNTRLERVAGKSFVQSNSLTFEIELQISKLPESVLTVKKPDRGFFGFRN